MCLSRLIADSSSPDSSDFTIYIPVVGYNFCSSSRTKQRNKPPRLSLYKLFLLPRTLTLYHLSNLLNSLHLLGLSLNIMSLASLPRLLKTWEAPHVCSYKILMLFHRLYSVCHCGRHFLCSIVFVSSEHRRGLHCLTFLKLVWSCGWFGWWIVSGLT